MNIFPLSFVLTVAVVLGGCSSSPPVRYHTLLPATSHMKATQPPVNFLIDVLPVGVPAAIDQTQLAVRDSSGGILLPDGERWAGPLPDEIHDALSESLAEELGTPASAGLGTQMNKPVMRVKVQVRRFDGQPGKSALLVADWTVGLAGEWQHDRLTCRSVVETGAPGTYPELVQAYRFNISQLSFKIAASARTLASTRRLTCPGA